MLSGASVDRLSPSAAAPLLLLAACCSCYASYSDEVDDVRDVSADAPGDPGPSDGVEVPDCSTCPPLPDAGAPPATCPPECTGGCEAGVCVVDCLAEAACTRDPPIVCPDGLECRVECGPSSCGEIQIIFSRAAAGELLCTGRGSCHQVEIYCSLAHPCSVRCEGQASCQMLNVWCGDGPCDLYCNPANEGHSPCIECAESCCCTTNCRLYRWCPFDL